MDAQASTALRIELVEYLRTRRALGYTLARTEKLLNQFIDFLETSKATALNTEAGSSP